MWVSSLDSSVTHDDGVSNKILSRTPGALDERIESRGCLVASNNSHEWSMDVAIRGEFVKLSAGLDVMAQQKLAWQERLSS